MNIVEKERRDKRHTLKRSQLKKKRLRDPELLNKERDNNKRFSRGKVVSHLAEMNRSASGADKSKKAIA